MIAELISREVRRSLSGAAWLPVAFFLLVAAIVPFAVGPDAKLLARIGGGALWIAALTAALLPIERLVEPDRADGFLDQLALAGVSEESVAFAKITGHWLTFGPLLLIAAVPASVLVGLDGPALLRAIIALAIGTPALAALAVAVAALRDPAAHAGATITVTGPAARTPRERVAALAEVLGVELATVDVPIPAFKEQLRGFGIPEWTVEGLGELFELYADGSAAGVSPEGEAVTGRPPRTWEQFAADHVAAFAP